MVHNVREHSGGICLVVQRDGWVAEGEFFLFFSFFFFCKIATDYVLHFFFLFFVHYCVFYTYKKERSALDVAVHKKENLADRTKASKKTCLRQSNTRETKKSEVDSANASGTQAKKGGGICKFVCFVFATLFVLYFIAVLCKLRGRCASEWRGYYVTKSTCF